MISIDGKNNGTVKGTKYFSCGENKGCFVQAAKLKKIAKLAAAAAASPLAKDSPKSPDVKSPAVKIPVSSTSAASPREAVAETPKDYFVDSPKSTTAAVTECGACVSHREAAAAQQQKIASLQLQNEELTTQLQLSRVAGSQSSSDAVYKEKIAALEVNFVSSYHSNFTRFTAPSSASPLSLLFSLVTPLFSLSSLFVSSVLAFLSLHSVLRAHRSSSPLCALHFLVSSLLSALSSLFTPH